MIHSNGRSSRILGLFAAGFLLSGLTLGCGDSGAKQQDASSGDGAGGGDRPAVKADSAGGETGMGVVADAPVGDGPQAQPDVPVTDSAGGLDVPRDTGPDLSRDFRQEGKCGEPGEPCCNSLACSAGYVCQDWTCQPCGAPGQQCCSDRACGKAGQVCGDDGKCGDCGGKGQPCCNGSTCAKNGCCVNQACVAEADACGAPLSGTCMNGSCGTCGAFGQGCCPGDICTGAQTRCIGGVCKRCGGNSGPCCIDDTCPTPDTVTIPGVCAPCTGGQNCVGGKMCVGCGGDVCCAGRVCPSVTDGMNMVRNFICTNRLGGPFEKCEGCGYAHGPCCAGRTCAAGYACAPVLGEPYGVCK